MGSRMKNNWCYNRSAILIQSITNVTCKTDSNFIPWPWSRKGYKSLNPTTTVGWHTNTMSAILVTLASYY